MAGSSKRIYVAGHTGMVGSAIKRCLELQAAGEVITRTRNELDLGDQRAVADFFSTNQIDEVYLAAAKVGGIFANSTLPYDFIYQNLQIQCNIINSAWTARVEKLIFLGSSCIYPKFANQPITEGELLRGELEATNEPYAIAKIAGIKLCESLNRQYDVDYRSVMPTNLYGPGDNYHPHNSHVIPGLIRRFHEAKLARAPFVNVWGTGKPRREFLYVDDMARACIHVMNIDKSVFRATMGGAKSHINVGFGDDITISELAKLIADTIGYSGEILYDSNKPDGTPRKLLDTSKLSALGWAAETGIREGLNATYRAFLEFQFQENLSV
jgi:GDP-L-fucose synthase